MSKYNWKLFYHKEGGSFASVPMFEFTTLKGLKKYLGKLLLMFDFDDVDYPKVVFDIFNGKNLYGIHDVIIEALVTKGKTSIKNNEQRLFMLTDKKIDLKVTLP